MSIIVAAVPAVSVKRDNRCRRHRCAVGTWKFTVTVTVAGDGEFARIFHYYHNGCGAFC